MLLLLRRSTCSTSPASASSSFHKLRRHRFYHRSHHRRLFLRLITTLSSTAFVNTFLISIIVYQFGTVSSASAVTRNDGDIVLNDSSPPSPPYNSPVDLEYFGSNRSGSKETGEDDDEGWAEEEEEDEDDGARNATKIIDDNVGGGDNTGVIIITEKNDKVEVPVKDDVSVHEETTSTTTSSTTASTYNTSNYRSNQNRRALPPAECTQEPRFSILTSESLLRSANVSYDEKAKEIWTFGRIYLVLECRASNPIDFNFDGHLINKLQSVEATRITYDHPRMPSCYSLSITIETNREATGNYSCWSLKEPILSTSLYIFAHGGTPPYLLHSDISSEIIEVETNIHDLVVVIPCVVTNPNISVALYKIEFEGFTYIPIGDYLSYDPKRGFLLHARKFPDPYGKYKCIAMNSSYYDVIVNVKQPTDNFFHDPIVQGRLEIVQDRLDTQSFICNSSSQNPMIVTTANCKTPIDCRLARKCLKKNPYCSSSCRCSIRGDKCSKTLESNYAQIGFPIDVGCSTIPSNLNGGIVECSAVNFEPSAEVTYFMGLNNKIVQNWRAVDPDELVEVETIEGIHKDDVLFVGEWIEFRCIASRFMFARGFQWKFKLENGTVINALTKPISPQVQETDSYIAEEMNVKMSHSDIIAIICHAPIWNETDWVSNSIPLIVKDSVKPSFKDDANTTMTFYINEKNNSILCEAEGFPTPDIMWLKDGEEYTDDLLLDRSIQNTSRSYVFMPEISLFDDGSVFICNATNPKGTVLKFYTLSIKEDTIKLTLTLAGAAFSLLIGVFAIVLWIFYTNSRRLKYGHVTDHDIEEFFNGNPEAIKKCGDGVAKAIYQPYDQKYEIDADDLLADYKDILGEGEFGVVLKGSLNTKEGQVPVAVKTTKDSDPFQLRTLLTEIKIIMHVGQHENIVQLMGAVTKDLKNRSVFVVEEFCQFGCLRDHLMKHRATFMDEFSPSAMLCKQTTSVSYVRLDCVIKTGDLISWAYQIANGLEYLDSKRIIHGDVALRNMLLDINQKVKITDFGLSKHVYKQTNQYVSKQKDTPLPWRWLAPETIRDYIFHSDVWSYGVVLYELFSLAETPFAGIEYSEEFLKLIENGFRLNQPRYANSEIYLTMRDCWRLNPKERPSITTLKQFFHQYNCMQHPPNQSEIVQQMQLHQFQLQSFCNVLDAGFSGDEKEDIMDAATLSSFLPPPTGNLSTFGSVHSMASASSGRKSRGMSS